MFDTINKESLDKLVDVFYNKAKEDEKLGVVFNAQITSAQKWARHKAVVSSFWLYHLTGIHNESAPKKHEGGMVGAHLAIPPFPREFFGIWLKLFEESLDELFTEQCKNEILSKAKDMAGKLQGVLYEGKEWVKPPQECEKNA